jgi:hypothetical protein
MGLARPEFEDRNGPGTECRTDFAAPVDKIVTGVFQQRLT